MNSLILGGDKGSLIVRGPSPNDPPSAGSVVVLEITGFQSVAVSLNSEAANQVIRAMLVLTNSKP